MPFRNEKNPLWFKDAVIYEVHIRSFCDSNGDGIGDFRGLLQKLPYLRDLGITAVWVLPFYPSPLRDDGYDIADYRSVHPDYGTLRDFQEFLKGAHALGMRVITELVLNHTSDQHPWFQKSRNAKPGSPWRDFYVWSDTPDKYLDARIIFKDFEVSNWTRDPVAKSYYWHRFYSHQPDLNYDNPRVHEAMFRVIDFWFGMGVDGLRLDAVPYLYEREGTNCENLPETYEFLKKLRAYIDAKYSDKMLLAEANQWPEDAASYFGGGAACQMAFHFPLMPRMFMALQMEDSFPIVNIMQQTPTIPQQCQWAMFLRNHDELTLEMVTDEERDYMYRIYARDPRARINLGIRRRLAPLMGDDRRKIELMNVLLFTMPGTPIIYYGDEIGMGDNYYLGDRNGVRTPMQWSPDRNAGFSPANPQKLYLPAIIDPEYHYEARNVENQAKNPSSLLWWMKRMIDLRKRFRAFGWGTLEFITLDNPKVLAMLRQYEDQTILVLINLSRATQFVQVNQPRFVGFYPEEMFSRNRFPAIKDSAYGVIMGPYDYHLLLLTDGREMTKPRQEGVLEEIAVTGSWENVLRAAGLRQLEQSVLPDYLRKSRWFQGKSRIMVRFSVLDRLPVPIDSSSVIITFLEVTYSEGAAEVYLLPLHYLPMDGGGEALLGDAPEAVICLLKVGDRPGVLYDGLHNSHLRWILFELIWRRKTLRGDSGRLWGRPASGMTALMEGKQPPFPSQVAKSEQSNSSVLFEKSFFFKLYRRMEEGAHPEVEIGTFLDRVHFPHVAPLAGALEYRRSNGESFALGLLQGFVPNQGDAWTFTLGQVGQFVDRVLAQREEARKSRVEPHPGNESSGYTTALLELIQGVYPEMVALIGRRTAEFHLALSSRNDDPDFAPEPFALLYQRSVYQSMRSRCKKVFDLLRKNMARIPQHIAGDAEGLLAMENDVLAVFQKFMVRKFGAMKTRVHGDYHLGQLLYTGDNFLIIDLEGEPVKSLSERRIKQSPLRDVAGMMRSFHYAAHAVIMQRTQVRDEDIAYLLPWVQAWYRYSATVFLQAYKEGVAGARFMPTALDEIEIMLQTFMLDKAIYELGYELNNRPEWVSIPLSGILDLLAVGPAAARPEGAEKGRTS
ncbi:maltose alpha-D-glucosyltransferase [Geomonas anaerohicana]|uniref:Maltokinase n=1 Tax=Geomonas anaerohicana TaxID=2798583 RepID=A0ABS0Y8Z4_9BACT|nr:maltose alpha-D-glucosyltransferase [Geomonas anaerohicana]MBJ6748768.1 maltose alpha-D-glucosyltransferase [Geomonas anaerohicana]